MLFRPTNGPKLKDSFTVLNNKEKLFDIIIFIQVHQHII